MATPAWYNEYYYLNSKLNQLNATGSTQYTTVNQVKTSIEGAGLTTYQHFSLYSLNERTSPDTWFSTNEYLAAKARSLNAAQGVTTWTAEQVALALQNAGYTNAYDHFHAFGWLENINPSNSFDVSSYLATKAATTGQSVEAVTAALVAGGQDPVQNYMQYGVTETGVYVTPVPAAEQVAADTSPGARGKPMFLPQVLTVLLPVTLVTQLSSVQKFFLDLLPVHFNAGDTITGGTSATDTLKVVDTLANGLNILAGVTVSGVEKLTVQNAAGGASFDRCKWSWIYRRGRPE